MTMKSNLKALIIFVLGISSCLAEEKVFFQLDPSTEWEVGSQSFGERQSLVELTLKGENVRKWKELFTIQKFANETDVSAEEFVSRLAQAFKRFKTEQEVNFQQLEPKNSNIVESTLISKERDSTLPQEEYHIGRILKGESSIYEIRYSTPDEILYSKNKPDWIARLKNAYVAEEPQKDQRGTWYAFTDEGIYKDGKRQPFEQAFVKLVDAKAKYAITLPSHWLVSHEWKKEQEFEPNRAYTIPLQFTRLDRQIYGGIAFYDVPNALEAFDPIDKFLENYEQNNKESELLGKGHVQTISGDQSQYMIIKEEGAVGWISFFEKDPRVFRLELWTPEDQFETLKDDLQQIILYFHLTE